MVAACLVTLLDKVRHKLKITMWNISLGALLCLLGTHSSRAFTIRPTVPNVGAITCTSSSRFNIRSKCTTCTPSPTFVTNRKQVIQYMYNLPPSKDDNDDEGLQDLIMGALSLAGLVAFFVSPLGGIFFALFNSIVALVFLTPVALYVGFQGWQYFNTVDGTCPNCTAPVKAMNNGSPGICLACGTPVQASGDQKTIERVDGGMGNMNGGMGGMGGMNSQDDFVSSFFDQAVGGSRSPLSDNEQKNADEEKKSAERRERTVIDVEVDKD